MNVYTGLARPGDVAKPARGGSAGLSLRQPLCHEFAHPHLKMKCEFPFNVFPWIAHQ